MNKKNDKMWHGRFTTYQNKLFNEFNSSMKEDFFLASFDIEGSKAHAKGLQKIGIFSESELELVTSALEDIKNKITNDEISPDDRDEDVHMWIERLLTEKLGILGKKIHTGRSRNDQVATASKLFLKFAYKQNMKLLKNLIKIIYEISKEHVDTIIPGYTHMQAAQPISLAFYLINYATKLKRDYDKFEDAYYHLDYLPLGCGALAGSNYAIDRDYLAKELNFKNITFNAMDAISDRDFVNDYLYISTLVINHLSQMSEDMIIWNSPQFNFIELSDQFSSGSSIMPQKKNPDGFELIRGKAALMSGRLMSMLSVCKGLAMSYNKDLQLDKTLMMETYNDMQIILQILPEILLTTKFKKNNMLNSVKKGFLNATDLADGLVERGMSFREAHTLVGKLVKIASDEGKALEELDLKIYQSEGEVFDEWIYDVLDYKNCMNNKKTKGSTSQKFVRQAILEFKEFF